MTRLVVCRDGTWNGPLMRSPTNVLRFAESLEQSDAQRVSYAKGVGLKPFERLRGGIFGYGLSREVRDAYAWVVEHFEPGDEIYALGFSRGAFTARSLVGLIRKAGVLRPEEAGRVDQAYDFYRRTDVKPADPEAEQWRARHSHETRIRFVGVWDTVGALGIPDLGIPFLSQLNKRYAFHDTQLSSHVDAAFHAVAVDERRKPFQPTLWEGRGIPGQVVEQVWFTGGHSDVGGGHRERGLADLTLWWMTEEARRHGLTFTGPPTPRDPSWTSAELHESRSGIFKLAPALDRPIGVADPDHERASTTAAQRCASDASYDPPELVRYLDRGGLVDPLD